MGCSQSTSASYVAAKAPADKFAPYLAAFNKAKAMESSNPNAAERAYKKALLALDAMQPPFTAPRSETGDNEGAEGRRCTGVCAQWAAVMDVGLQGLEALLDRQGRRIGALFHRRRLEIIRAATEGGWLHDEDHGIKRSDEPLSATASEEMYRVSIHSSEADDVRVRDQP